MSTQSDNLRILWDNILETLDDIRLGLKVTGEIIVDSIRALRFAIVQAYERWRWPVILKDLPRPAIDEHGNIVFYLADDEPFPAPWVEEDEE